MPESLRTAGGRMPMLERREEMLERREEMLERR